MNGFIFSSLHRLDTYWTADTHADLSLRLCLCLSLSLSPTLSVFLIKNCYVAPARANSPKIRSTSSSAVNASFSMPTGCLVSTNGLSCSACSLREPRKLARKNSFCWAIRSSSSRRRRSCSCESFEKKRNQITLLVNIFAPQSRVSK